MTDYSLRLPATNERIAILEKESQSKKLLPKIKDYLYKPIGTNLKDFHPNQVCIRLREFLNENKPSTLLKITTIQTPSGYTDQKEDLGQGKTSALINQTKILHLEKWGQLSTVSTEYSLQYAKVLLQTQKPIGQFLKIEASTQNNLNKTLKLLKAKKSEKISVNAAVLLAQRLRLL